MKTTTPNIEEYCANLIVFNKFIGQEIIHPLMDLTEIMSNNSNFFFYSILLKSNNALRSNTALFNNYREHPQFLDTICLTFRTMMSDFISFQYILFKSGEDENRRRETIECLQFDHLEFTLKNLKTFGDLYKDNPKKVNDLKKQLIINNKKFYDEKGNLYPHLKKNRWPKCSEIVKKIVSDRNNPYVHMEWLTYSFEYYMLFSKYEHLGELTPLFVHRSFKRESQLQILNEINISFKLIYSFQLLLIEVLLTKKNDEVKKQKFKSLFDRIYDVQQILI